MEVFRRPVTPALSVVAAEISVPTDDEHPPWMKQVHRRPNEVTVNLVRIEGVNQ